MQIKNRNSSTGAASGGILARKARQCWSFISWNQLTTSRSVATDLVRGLIFPATQWFTKLGYRPALVRQGRIEVPGRPVPIASHFLNRQPRKRPFFTALLLLSAAGSAAAQVPDAPTIGNAAAGDASAYVFYTGPGSSAGSPITSYTATCISALGGSTATGVGQTAPIAVSGLVNGSSYQCNVIASNATGTSAPSASVSVTPQAAAPLTLIGVVSRKTHVGRGVFDIPLSTAIPIAGPVSVEPRARRDGHRIVFQFNATVTSVSSVNVLDETSAFVSASTTFAGNEVVVQLPAVANNKRVAVSVPTVNGIAVNAAVSAGLLLGDVNNAHAVNAAGLSNMKARSGRTTGAGNFRFDLNASGAITAADIAAIKTRSGTFLTATSIPVVARVAIDQTGLVLTQAGAFRQLSAKATDAAGNVLNVPIGWSASRPANIAVDGSGLASAVSANGTSQIIASAGGVSSAPLLAIVTPVAPGAILLTDAQIVGEPVETTPDAVPAFTNTYQVSLTGVAAPTIGDILINTESKMVAGRVVTVNSSGNPSIVTLGLLTLREMFPTLDIDETIDMTNAPVSIPADIAAAYDVVRSGDTYTFTPKAGATGAGAAAVSKGAALPNTSLKGPAVNGIRRDGPVGTSALPPFTNCETTITGRGPGAPLPIVLSAPPLFSVSINPTLDFKYNAAGAQGVERFIVRAKPTIKIEGGVNVVAAFEGKVECKAELIVYQVPVGGVLALIIGGLVPVGVGIEAGGKITLATMGIGSKVELIADAKAGFSCVGGGFDCNLERGLDIAPPKFTPTLNAPSIGDIRLEPKFSAFGYVDASVGNPFLKSLRFNFIKIKASADLLCSFALKESQLADPLYKSDYKLQLKAGVTAGSNLSEALRLFGLFSINVLELAITTDIAKSPAALLVGAVVADKATFVTGDTVNFTVKLDPATVDFLPIIGPYNVKNIQLVRDQTGSPVVVGSVDAAPGQMVFNFSFTAPNAGTTSQFSAFVVTTLLPFDLLALEVGGATVAAPRVGNRIAAGGDFSCGISAAGGARCWGNQSDGRLGNGMVNFTGQSVPVDVTGLTSGVVSISAGGGHACALTSAGGVKCWGANFGGQLGNGTTTGSSVPVDVTGLSSGVVAVSAGGGHTCVITTGGAVKCWGFNAGRLGNGTTTNSSVPVDVTGLSSGVASVSAMGQHTCAVTSAGAGMCWGTNNFGQLGNGAMTMSTIPVDVTGLSSGVAAFSGGDNFTCAVTTAGSVKCWGLNGSGEFGNGTVSFGESLPVDVTGLSSGTVAISSGANHSCAVSSVGGVKCWGTNFSGRLGNGTDGTTIETTYLTPVDVTGLSSGAVAISSRSTHTCIVTATGAAKCWGSSNTAGQLGDGTTTDRLIPVDVVNFP